ncbi:MAG TPA: acetate/propionate family kinase [Magnetospirillum sp.]|jgi:acetate kinase|nr:acetate/propionate family kinase [Magnetospirillum sp.]
MDELVLILNAGSSSVKFAVYDEQADGLKEICSGQAEGLLTTPRFSARREGGGREEHAIAETGHDAAIMFLATWLRATFPGAKLWAVGHRVVHGGDPPPGPTLVDEALLARLEELIPQMPLHLPHNLAPMRTIARLQPEVPQVACFDTSFHRTMPRVEQIFAIPRALIAEGVRRYGFHGLSYEYVARRLKAVAPDIADGKVVVAHLGSGASMCAMEGGRSVATTMGFTGLDGLPMGTRPGSVDPGILLYLMEAKGMGAHEMEDFLYRRCGLLGLSGGISNDMRELLASDAPEAAEAVDYFIHRACRELGSLAAALGGLDALVFTAGIGERSAFIRAAICRRSSWLGIELDERANNENRTIISRPGSAVTVLVVPTDENRVIAEQTHALVQQREIAP